MTRPDFLLLLARLLLLLDATLYVLIGIGVMLHPETMKDQGIAMVTATGITTTRTWGGLFTGVGAGGLVMSAKREFVGPGLLLFVVVAAAIVIARACGMWVDGLEPRQWTELRREGIGLGIALLGLGLLLRRGRQP
jgi:hypothetical protein